MRKGEASPRRNSFPMSAPLVILGPGTVEVGEGLWIEGSAEVPGGEG